MTKKLLALSILLLTISFSQAQELIKIESIFVSSQAKNSDLNREAIENRFNQYWEGSISEDRNVSISVYHAIPPEKREKNQMDFDEKLNNRIDKILNRPKKERLNTVVFVHVYDHGVNGGKLLPMIKTKYGRFDPEEAILNRLKGKVKFVVVLVDACNDLEPFSGESTVSSLKVKLPNIKISELIQKNYLEPTKKNQKYNFTPSQPWMQNGFLTIATSRVGQKSYVHPSFGSYGSHIYYGTLDVYQQEKYQSWENILSTFSENTYEVSLKRQQALFFGQINGQKISKDSFFLPVSSYLTKSKVSEYLGRFKGHNIASLKKEALESVRNFCILENEKSFLTKEFKNITVPHDQFLHFDEHDYNYILLDDYKDKFGVTTQRKRSRLLKKRNQSIINQLPSYFHSSFIIEDLEYLGLYRDDVLFRDDVLLFTCPKVIYHNGKSDTLIQILGVQVTHKRLNKRKLVCRVDRVVNLPKIVIETPNMVPTLPNDTLLENKTNVIPPPLTHIDQKALNAFENNWFYMTEDFYKWLGFIASNFNDDSTKTDALIQAEKIFQNTNLDTMETTIFLPDSSIVSNKRTINDQIDYLYSTFTRNYDLVRYSFCQEESILENIKDVNSRFETVENSKQWRAYVKFNQHFIGKKMDTEKYFDRTTKVVEFIITRIDGESDSPEFDIKIKAVKVIDTKKDNFCNPIPRA